MITYEETRFSREYAERLSNFGNGTDCVGCTAFTRPERVCDKLRRAGDCQQRRAERRHLLSAALEIARWGMMHNREPAARLLIQALLSVRD